MMTLILLFALTITWLDNSNNENGFFIEKTVSGNCTDGWQLFAYVGVNVTSIVDSMASPGNCYRLAAFNDYGVSPYSKSGQVPTPPQCVPKGKSGKCR